MIAFPDFLHEYAARKKKERVRDGDLCTDVSEVTAETSLHRELATFGAAAAFSLRDWSASLFRNPTEKNSGVSDMARTLHARISIAPEAPHFRHPKKIKETFV